MEMTKNGFRYSSKIGGWKVEVKYFFHFDKDGIVSEGGTGHVAILTNGKDKVHIEFDYIGKTPHEDADEYKVEGWGIDDPNDFYTFPRFNLKPGEEYCPPGHWENRFKIYITREIIPKIQSWYPEEKGRNGGLK